MAQIRIYNNHAVVYRDDIRGLIDGLTVSKEAGIKIAKENKGIKVYLMHGSIVNIKDIVDINNGNEIIIYPCRTAKPESKLYYDINISNGRIAVSRSTGRYRLTTEIENEIRAMNNIMIDIIDMYKDVAFLGRLTTDTIDVMQSGKVIALVGKAQLENSVEQKQAEYEYRNNEDIPKILREIREREGILTYIWDGEIRALYKENRDGYN